MNMKNIISKTVVAGLVAAAASTVVAQEVVLSSQDRTLEEVVVSDVPATSVSVSADFASAYVFRGVTFNDEAVFQPGIEASGFGMKEEWGSITVGAWGNFDIGDYDNNLESSEFSEVDWYASYGLPSLVDGLDIALGWTEYTYPSGGGDSDKEANVGLGYEIVGIGLGATAYYMVGGAGTGNAYYELAAGYELEVAENLALALGASAGYSDPDSGEDGWNDGTLSIGLGYALNENWSVSVSGTYIAQLDDDVLVDDDIDAGEFGYDVEGVGMFSLAGSF
jgi:uncharacterized protein (TIGR02001 family)